MQLGSNSCNEKLIVNLKLTKELDEENSKCNSFEANYIWFKFVCSNRPNIRYKVVLERRVHVTIFSSILIYQYLDPWKDNIVALRLSEAKYTAHAEAGCLMIKVIVKRTKTWIYETNTTIVDNKLSIKSL